jgi:uncharacterized protein
MTGTMTGLHYRFGPFTVDAMSRVLVAGGASLAMPEKIFRVLQLLLEADGHIVGRERFLDTVWPSDASTSDANLSQHVWMLRRMLAERGGAKPFIITVPGEGYRLGVPVEQKAGLMMKSVCQRCGTSLQPSGCASICSYECTFCDGCTRAMHGRCMNCGDELVARPRRTS